MIIILHKHTLKSPPTNRKLVGSYALLGTEYCKVGTRYVLLKEKEKDKPCQLE